MATIKGICKSFKCLSHIFVVKEREIEIGFPTDVKHVTHIGWDGTSGSPPSWMAEFKSGPQFSGLSVGRGGETRDQNSLASWSSQDFDENMKGSQAGSMPKSLQPSDLPNIPKKHKRRKSKLTSSPTPSSSKPGKSKPPKDKKSTLDVI